MHVVATSGHVDHGKSTLVRALTGTDPDRLAEEKARGLTIDLGFASMTLPSGCGIAFIDVPGHVRFIKNMLAGVGAVDACLFVVAASEGWKPQSEEHLRILDLLGIPAGVVALTKAGAVDPSTLQKRVEEVRAHLDGSRLADAPIIAVDTPRGTGLDELSLALEALVATTPVARDRGRPRLWIDRCFAAAGSGTVVTGTLTGGSLALHDVLHIVPGPGQAHEPIAVRVRALQTHGQPQERVEPGHRVAVGVSRVGHDRLDRSAVVRGQALVRAGQWSPTSMLDASLVVLATAPAPVARRGAFCAYFGSGEHAVRLRVLGGEAIDPGGVGTARLHLPVPLALLPGDRFILRDVGRAMTVGGGEVLDVAPVRRAARARPDRSVDRVITERGWVDADELERLTGERRPPVVAGRWVVDPTLLAQTRQRLVQAIETAGPFGLDMAALDPRDRMVVAALADEGIVRAEDGRARGSDSRPELESSLFLNALRAAPFAPPDAATFGVDRRELRELLSAGLVAEREGHYFAASAVDTGSRIVAELLARSPEGITVSQVRESLGSTRKYVLPLLALLDARGVTRRRGEVRIAGPRLPRLEEPAGRAHGSTQFPLNIEEASHGS